MEEKQDIGKKVETLKKEIHLISTKLKELSDQKEEHYKQKNSLDAKLNKLISKAKQHKDDKKETDNKIKVLKKEREKANVLFNKALTDLREAQNRRREMIKKSSVVSPNKIRAQIKDLEYKIQTEALKFEKEKKIMGQINKLKLELEKSLAEQNKFKEVEEFKKQSQDLKKKADDVHKEIQACADKSSKLFDDLTKLSKDIADIKAKRNTSQVVLKGLKSQISQLNHKLSKTLKEWSGIADHTMKRRAKRGLELVHKKTEEVKEKLKAKKKLTTDDILLLQREAMGK